jgi:hypothetical protein
MKAYLIFSRRILLQCYIALVTVISFCSCTHVYYSPNSGNVPLFKKKGEARINGYYSLGSTITDNIKGGEVQAAYAVSNHVGVMLNTAFMGASNGSGSQKDAGNGSLIEAGAGYYKPLRKNYVFETYGGVGLGSVKNEYSTGGSSKINFSKFFVQPSFGYSITNFDIGLVSKFSFVNMTINHSTFPNGNDPFKTYDIDYIKANPFSVLWEPSLFLRIGFKTVKAQFQYTPSYNLNNKMLAQNLAVLSCGLSISLKPKIINE